MRVPDLTRKCSTHAAISCCRWVWCTLHTQHDIIRASRLRLGPAGKEREDYCLIFLCICPLLNPEDNLPSEKRISVWRHNSLYACGFWWCHVIWVHLTPLLETNLGGTITVVPRSPPASFCYIMTSGRTENRESKVCTHHPVGIHTLLSWLHVLNIADLRT